MFNNNMFGTGFGPSAGMTGWNNQGVAKQTTPTKQQKFPGLSTDQIKRLESLTSDPQEQQKLYQQAIQQLKQNNTRDNRIATENEMTYRSVNQTDNKQANYMQSNVRLEQLADLAKDKFGLNQTAKTQDVVNGLMTMAEDQGIGLNSLNDYLEKGDETFLYEMGLAEHPQQSNALSIKGTVADNKGGEWNDNLFGRFETEQYDKNASLGENALTFGKNLLKSGVNVLSDVGNMIVNPLDTANALGKTAVGGVANLLGVDEDMAQWGDRFNSANDTADQVGQFFSDRYGGGEQILNTLFTDPVGVISDAATLISGGAGAVKGITTGAAKATAKAGLKGTTRALERTSNTAGKIAKAGLEYDPYSVAMKLEMKPISATIDYAKKVPGASKVMKEKLNEALDKAVGLDENTKRNIQNNPFSKEVWQKAKTWIDANGLPEKSTEVSKQLITDVADRVQETMKKQMSELGETGPMYQPLKEAGFSVDLSELKAGLDNMLNEYGIKIEDGKLDFSKTAIDGSEANNIKKIYDRVQSTDAPMSMTEYLERFRKTISDMVDFNTNNRDAIGKKLGDTPGDKVLKGIRESANKLAHEQVPALKDLDAVFKKQTDLIKEVTDGIVYKDKTKMGAVRDNINQIIKNLDEPNRRVLKNRLEKVLPGIEEEVKAINMLPKLIDRYYKPSKMQQTLTSSAGAAVGGSIGGIPGGILGAGAGYILSNRIDKLKSNKWDKVISTTSEEGASKMSDIQSRIANNEKISQAQKAFLGEISEKLKAGKQVKEAEITRIISEVAGAEEGKELAVLDKAIKELETLGAKEEVKQIKDLREGVVKNIDEQAEMNRYAEEFEAEKQNIMNESADQRLPEFKRRIYQLGQEERRIGSVAGKKIGKNFEGKDYHRQQQTEWLRKKDKLIEEIGEYYNVDQFEASEIFDRIERQASADDLGFSGKPASSKTAKYQVADQTNTPEFKKRFEGSKVVDENGNPLVVYHGSKQGNFNIFDRAKIGKQTDSGMLGRGFYFSSDIDYSKTYGDTRAFYLDIKKPFEIKTEADQDRFFDLYLKDISLKHMQETQGTLKGYGEWSDKMKERNTQALRDKGYDGVIWYDRGKKEYVVFEPNQIKSATDNIGTFDKNNPDIRYQKYGTANPNEKGISATEGLNIRNFKNGKTVQELANQYGIDTKIVDSISTPEGQRAYGMYGDRLITLSKDLVESTVPHELLHGVFDIVDSKRRTSILEGIQKKLNIDNVQAEEWLADNFSEYYRTGKFGTKGLAKTFVEKVKQFFYEVKSYIDGTYKNEKQIRQLFDDIIDGKIEGEYGVYSDPKFQSVWHGSPADFERFDSAHMGEGEGAQAHGWGHYVAVEERTGRHYAEIRPQEYSYKGVKSSDIAKKIIDSKFDGVDYLEGNANAILNKMQDGMDFEEAKKQTIENYKDLRDLYEENEQYEDLKKINKEIDFLENIKESDIAKEKRNLYEVEIPDPIKKDTPTGSNYLEEGEQISGEEAMRFIKKVNEIDKKLGDNLQERLVFEDDGEYYTNGYIDGRKVYNNLEDLLGSDKAASKFLQSLGYDGIHYFGGRDGEAYVIFNDDALQITKHHKY